VLVLRTIGVYHSHDVCSVLTRHVLSKSTSAEDGKKEVLWSLRMSMLSRKWLTDMGNAYPIVLFVYLLKTFLFE